MGVFLFELLINCCLVIAPEYLEIRSLPFPLEKTGVNAVLEFRLIGNVYFNLMDKKMFSGKNDPDITFFTGSGIL